MRGITVWSRVRGWAAMTGVLAAVLLTTACHVNDPRANAAASPSPTNAAKTSARTASVPSISALTASAPVTTASAPATTGPVVALGDSYTAGALLPLASAAKPHASVLRLSIGLEDVDDLRADLAQAMASTAEPLSTAVAAKP